MLRRPSCSSSPRCARKFLKNGARSDPLCRRESVAGRPAGQGHPRTDRVSRPGTGHIGPHQRLPGYGVLDALSVRWPAAVVPLWMVSGPCGDALLCTVEVRMALSTVPGTDVPIAAMEPERLGDCATRARETLPAVRSGVGIWR